MVQLGIDRLEEYAPRLKGRRIGLITNYSGISSFMEDDLDVFFRLGLKVRKVFTPEHGLYGAMDGQAVESSVHPKYGIPVISLYGSHIRPTEEDLSGLDTLVYDIQDVGLRYYTYIYTLAECLQQAAQEGLDFYVLDRPDPLGHTVEGNRMESCFAGFTGNHRLCLRYGMTPGELGRYYIHYFDLDVSYQVIPMTGLDPSWTFPETGLVWNLPSPSIHTFSTLECYLGGCFFEACNISEGRGTAEPFQMYGAPFVDMDRLYARLMENFHRQIPAERSSVLLGQTSKEEKAQLAVRKRAFTPFWSKHTGKTCFGVEFIPLSSHLDFLPYAMVTMKTFRELYPEDFTFLSYADVSRLSSLTGGEEVMQYMEGKLSLQQVLAGWQTQERSFSEEIKEYRIYES